MVEGEKPGEVDEPYAIEVYTSEVTQHRRGRYHINSPREISRSRAYLDYRETAQGQLG